MRWHQAAAAVLATLLTLAAIPAAQAGSADAEWTVERTVTVAGEEVTARLHVECSGGGDPCSGNLTTDPAPPAIHEEEQVEVGDVTVQVTVHAECGGSTEDGVCSVDASTSPDAQEWVEEVLGWLCVGSFCVF